ncbi:MAG: AAA family ATPase [Bacteroidaceae bacterium]|nr:AAA family ATPase [Bacteroidaceae bacterium]
MKIIDINIENFRGFAHKSFAFDPKINVILGDNTTGKTTLLQAVQIALGAFLQEMSFLPGGNGYSRNFRPTDQVKVFSESSKGFIPLAAKPSIEVNAECVVGQFDESTQQINTRTSHIWWKRTSNKNSKANTQELMDFVADLENRRRNADKDGKNSLFPLFLSFGATRLEKNYKGAEKTKQRETREARAYKCALDEQVDFKGAFDWIYRYEKNYNKGGEFVGTNEAFLNAIKEAIPAIQQIDIDTKNNEFTALIKMAKDETPYWLTYDMMSAGFKAMINITAEIAHRCIELNGFLGIEAVKKTPGIIMIDEVDLYLHPHWQQHILADLQTAFPEMQFIVTTHSPFIVQSVESKNVITLDGNISPLSPSQRGVEEISACEMGMEGMLRSEVYRKKQQLALKYFELVKAGKNSEIETEKVRKELNNLELEASLFHDPAYESFLKLNRGKL